MRRGGLLVGLLLGLAACGSEDVRTDRPEPAEGTAEKPVALRQVEASPREDVPSALDDMAHPDFPDPIIDPDEIVSGGPPPDGIPAIDEPRFQRAADIDWLDDAEAVLSVTVRGERLSGTGPDLARDRQRHHRGSADRGDVLSLVQLGRGLRPPRR